MNPLRIPVVSPEQILHDLTDCVTSTNVKIAKRLRRLEVVCKCLDINYDDYLSKLTIPVESILEFEEAALDDYLSKPPCKNDDPVVRLEETDQSDDKYKKTLEALLTASLNNDMVLYLATSEIAVKIVKRLSNHSIFGPLLRDKKIVFVHKGGIAQRLSLLQSFPQYEDEILSAFNLGGDNDCTIIVDPVLPCYNFIRSLLVGYVRHCMIEFVSRFSEGPVNQKAYEIRSIEFESIKIDVQPVNRKNFQIYETGGVSYMDIDVYTLTNGVYTTSNDTLNFIDEVGRICHFTLIRYKRSFQVGNRVIGAELLDISIPHKDEEKASEKFHEYQSGNWVSYVTL